MSKIAVIGDGAWGTALALVLHQNGHRVTIWGPFEEYLQTVRETHENRKFLPGVSLPQDLIWTADHTAAAADCDVAVLATPSRFYKGVVESFAEIIPKDALTVSVTKGLEQATHTRMTEVAAAALSAKPVAALSGPSHAEEVARGAPTAVVIACKDHDRAVALQDVFTNKMFRIYTSDDVVGTELGGAMKNVIAVAAGICDGLGFGDNTKAALLTRGLAEMSRLGAALGAHPNTFSGLSGMGDLIVTCTSKLSRNRAVGERLGKGETLEDIMNSMEQVAEGVWNCQAACDLAADVGIEVPIADEVNQVVHDGKDPRSAVESLLDRDPRPERDT